ncbi:MAG TPA: hypothetical protein PKA41_17425 [Verrucomicrobiota bacterium]|nr:hypothetical protein [Verrucomicrobiota bacterium]
MSTASNIEQEYEVIENCAVARFKGEATLWQAVELVETAMARAMTEKTRKLLVNISAITGFPSPHLADRYFIVRRWAQFAKGELVMALVIQEHMMDPERFGIVVARNAGMLAEVFHLENEALTWLKTCA